MYIIRCILANIMPNQQLSLISLTLKVAAMTSKDCISSKIFTARICKQGANFTNFLCLKRCTEAPVIANFLTLLYAH